MNFYFILAPILYFNTPYQVIHTSIIYNDSIYSNHISLESSLEISVEHLDVLTLDSHYIYIYIS